MRAALAIVLLAAGFAAAPSALATPTKSNGPTSQLVGDWRGRSLCVTTTRPACTDETVLYRIRRAGTGDGFTLDASKLVDDKMESMGAVFECSFETTRQQLICPMGNSRWQFRWDGTQLVGGLIDPDGPFRFVRVDKLKP